MKLEKIGILGIGKLGLCFALNLERSGYEVLGVDVSPDYVEEINSKKFISSEPKVNQYLLASRNFTATLDLAQLINEEISTIFIAVATPSNPDGGYNHDQINRVFGELKTFGPRRKVCDLVIVATTMPGYCDVAAKSIEGLNYRLSYNPEFIAQGNIIHDQQYPDQVLIGEANEDAGDKIEAIYKKMCLNEPVFCRMNRLSAEICKIATNCFLTTKISFANSIGDLATKVGAEPEKILAAIGSDSRIGSKYLGYGFGFGGPCFPRDNRALGKFAVDSGYELLISKATDEVNRRHLEFQFQQWMENIPQEKVITFEYITYKKGTFLTEESQQLALAIKLAKAGRKVHINDQKQVIDWLISTYGDLFTYQIT